MSRLLVFGSFADDAESILAAVQRLARVCVKHGLQFLLGDVERSCSGVELRATGYTYAQSVALSFGNHAKAALWHGSSLARPMEGM